MNINISYKWLKEYLPTAHSPADLARLLSLSGPSVERMHHFGGEWDKMVVGEILDINPHPNADKLRIAHTDIGSRKLDIVCGGSNIRKGMKVAVALPGARMRWHGEGDLVELKPTEIRGVRSEAMIAAANEIGLFEGFPHKEREVMDLSECSARPSTPLAKALELEDTIFDTEVTTNRPDLLGMIGFAREAGAITRERFDEKKIAELLAMPSLGHKEKVLVKIEAKKYCPRYAAVLVKGVNVAPSPWWLRLRLMRAGIRPICNIVDITNYAMLATGQPMHAFDASKVEGEIVVRSAKRKEKIIALDGNTYTPPTDCLVIADKRKALAIAGIMGGTESGVLPGTKDIIFEAATFDASSVRKSSRELGLRSESSARFEKGLSEDGPHRALGLAARLAGELACGIPGPITDARGGKYAPLKFSVTVADAQKLIGAPVPGGEMKRILTSLGFKLKATSKKLQAVVPYFRDHDIESGRDLVEEIARIYGYHRLPGRLPTGEIPTGAKSPEPVLLDAVREALRGAGLNEVINYSFISGLAMAHMGFDASRAIRLSNPLTADFEFMRTSLLPGILDVIRKNQENFPSARIFETGNIYHPRPNDLPREELNLAAAISSKKGDASPFFALKGILEVFANRFALKDLGLKRDVPNTTLWHPGRSAVVSWKGKSVGTLGEIHPSVLNKFGIEHRVAVLELAMPELLPHMKSFGQFTPMPAYPSAKRDISFIVSAKTPYEKIESVMTGGNKLIAKVELFDVYEGEHAGPGKKSMAFHIDYQSSEKTLTSEEVETAHAKLGLILQKELGAEVRNG